MTKPYPPYTVAYSGSWTTTSSYDPWVAERDEVLGIFLDELSKATGDGSKKRQSGDKPPWYADESHEAAIFSHITKWKRGELVDPDSGAHPLVHAAWRCLAIACRETGHVPPKVVEVDYDKANFEC